ncbi:MAG: NUDIX domain-containing protein [Alphaproteobacteria bacterium]|nr:NUDIX domain-containing protein [Alphaproteobacteria bacterium]
MTDILLVAACALIDADGRTLLAQRPPGKKQAGLWEFPGGKVEQGESPEAALVRELQEELSINVTASCLAPFAFASSDLGGVHLLMPLFLCRKWQGAPQPIEATAVKWASPDRLMAFDLVPADRPLAAQLQDFLWR